MSSRTGTPALPMMVFDRTNRTLFVRKTPAHSQTESDQAAARMAIPETQWATTAQKQCLQLHLGPRVKIINPSFAPTTSFTRPLRMSLHLVWPTTDRLLFLHAAQLVSLVHRQLGAVVRVHEL